MKSRISKLLILFVIFQSCYSQIIAQVNKHYIGEFFGGGIIFYIDKSGEHGLICSLIDISTNSCWSNVRDKSEINAQSQWNGELNTKEIIKQKGHIESAAKKCIEYINFNYGTGTHNDWYLPAIDELNLIYNSKFQINQALELDNNSETTPIVDYIEGLSTSGTNGGFYWSSTNEYADYAFYYSFCLGMTQSYHTPNNYHFNKKNELRVRAVRKF